MADVVIVEAVRTPVGRRNGGLSTVHPADLLGTALTALVERSGIDPAEVEQVVGGCVSQVGEQSFNITRTAWLAAGPPPRGRRHHRRHPVRLVAAGDQPGHQPGGRRAWPTSPWPAASSSMSRIPIGSNSSKKLGLGVPIPKAYFGQYEFTSQFEGAERIAEKWGITRDDTDAFGLRSQQRAAQAWAEGRFGTQIVEVDAPDVDDEGKPTRHHPPRRPGRGPAGDHAREAGRRSSRWPGRTASTPPGRRSQISDGAAAVLLMTAEQAAELGLTPRARVVDTCLVGVDPVLMLTGPIDATQRLLERTGIGVDRHRRVRDQRGLRLGRAGLAEGARRRPRQGQPQRRRHRPRPPARRPPARCSSPRPSTSSSAPAAATASSRCAAAAASAPAPSSSAWADHVPDVPGLAVQGRRRVLPTDEPALGSWSSDRRTSLSPEVRRRASRPLTCSSVSRWPCSWPGASLLDRRRVRSAGHRHRRAGGRRRHRRRPGRSAGRDGPPARHRHPRDGRARRPGRAASGPRPRPAPRSCSRRDGGPAGPRRRGPRPLRPAARLRHPGRRRPVRQPISPGRRVRPPAVDRPQRRATGPSWPPPRPRPGPPVGACGAPAPTRDRPPVADDSGR